MVTKSVGKKIENYDISRTYEATDLFEGAIFSVRDHGTDNPKNIYVPKRVMEGRTPEEAQTLAAHTYTSFKRAEDWQEKNRWSYGGEFELKTAAGFFTAVYMLVISNCRAVYLERLKQDSKESLDERNYAQALHEKLRDKKLDVKLTRENAESRYQSWLESAGSENARAYAQALLSAINTHIAAGAIYEADNEVLATEPDLVWDEAFRRHFLAEYSQSFGFFFLNYARDKAKNILEDELKPIDLPFEELRTWAGLVWLEERSDNFPNRDEAQTTAMVIATSQLMGHQYSFITSRADILPGDLKLIKSGRTELLRARSRLDLPRGVERPSTIVLLEKMQKTLLRHKEEAASLLKTHLYLVDRAYKQGGDNPTFTVDMDNLLEAKGYTRRDDGGFQASTYREEWGRIATLAGCWLELRRATGKNRRGKEETLIDETPYWEVRGRRRLENGDALGLQAILLANPEAPIIKQVVIQPGVWWGISDRGTMKFHLPYEVLALPTDGNGNESRRYAVQLAATLALWVRSSQQHHAGKELKYSVGALLEASGIKTRSEFDALHRVQAARLREYLAGNVGESTPKGVELGGALSHLVRLNAFNICIQDQDQFWASGRGWITRFWDSQLAVQIPGLGIRKMDSPKTTKSRRRNRTA